MQGAGFLKLGLLGLAAYVVFLLATLPAAFAWQFLGVRLDGLPALSAPPPSGTLWAGEFHDIAYRDLVVESLSWNLRPSELMTGRLGLDWQLSGPFGHGSGRLAFGAGDVELADIRLDVGAAAITAVAPQLGFPMEGRFLLDLRRGRASYERGVSQADGVLGWIDAGAGLTKAHDLGDLRADIIHAEDGGVRLSIADQGGPLRLVGTAQWDRVDGLRFEAQAGARDGAASELVEGIEMLGRPQADGLYRLSFRSR